LESREPRMTEDEFKIVRRAYAKQIMAAVQVVDKHIESGFAEVPREDFLGPGPRPADARLNNSGRLILPLTIDRGFTTGGWANMPLRGALFLIVRQGTEFHTQWISPVAIYPCQGMCDTASENALAAALERGGWKRVTRCIEQMMFQTSVAG
jgi:hypothetical protein